jgi:L-alanine-DL-glutamate epimerase-like enolase superfamily enzyme
VREAAGPEAALRLDANGAWSEAKALRALERFSAWGIEFVEQPVAPGDVGALARVRRGSPVPVAADESVTGERAVEALLAGQAADLLVLKPPVLGGLRAGRRVAERARGAGVGVTVTSLLDSAIGRAAALHLAAAVPGPIPACGLATGGFLRRDLAAGAIDSRGEIALPAPPGLGVTPEAGALQQCAIGPEEEILS